jgi:folate-binding protein YgfZ
VLVSAAREDELRVELGLPRFGVDFGTSHYPQETSLHTLGVSFSKGCYLGQEVLYMLEHRGHAKKKLVRLHGESTLPAIAAGSSQPVLSADASDIGQAASASGAWAIAMVKQAHAEAEASLTLSGIACRVSPVNAG